MYILPNPTSLSFLPRIAVAICFLLFSSSASVQAQLVDRVVAVVNSEIILLSELNEEIALIQDKIEKELPPEQQQDALFNIREEGLDSIIDKKLIQQTAREARVSVSEQEVDKAVQDVRSRAQLTEEQFTHELNKSGLSLATYRENIKSQLLQRKIVNYDIRSRIVISESAIRDYYDNEFTVNTVANEFYLLQMGFTWGGDRTQDESLKEAERVRKLAMSGADFEDLAKKYSQLPSASGGGDIGTFSLDDMSAPMAQAIGPLRAGQISPIIGTPAGYQFFKVVSAQGGAEVEKPPFEDVKATIQATLFEEEMQKAFQKWIRGIKEDAYIQKM